MARKRGSELVRWQRIAQYVAAFAIVACVWDWLYGPRPQFLPLRASIDGPSPSSASGVLVFLHGRGGSVRHVKQVAEELRADGLSPNISIVLIEAPYTTGFGHSWGNTAEEQTVSRARIRARLHDLVGDAPKAPIIIAGFSQGAGLAIDVAVEDARISALASLSPCYSALRGELPKRDLRILLAHGKNDAICPVNESRSLSRALEAAHKPAHYIEFDGGHKIPPEILHALATFAAP